MLGFHWHNCLDSVAVAVVWPEHALQVPDVNNLAGPVNCSRPSFQVLVAFVELVARVFHGFQCHRFPC